MIQSLDRKPMIHKITLIPGDGIGPEVTQAAVRILEATGLKFEWETFEAGADAYEKYHEYIPRELIESIERTRVGLKGPVTTPIGGGFASINVELRKRFELYANFRPIRNLPHIPTRYPDVDLIIVRENTEGLYSGLEHEVVPGVVESLKVITEKASNRIARFAFEYARKNHRKKIHAIHKANIMKLSDGLFLRCALLMLRHIGEFDAALKIRNALEKVYRDRDKLTRDVGGKAGTSEFADSVIEAMETSAVVSHR